MRMMMISMSSVTLVVLDAVQERWFSYCDHQNPLSCSTACPGLPVHAVRPLSSFSSEFLTLEVLLLDTVQKACPTCPLESVDSWGKPVTAHRSVAVCHVWSQEEVTNAGSPAQMSHHSRPSLRRSKPCPNTPKEGRLRPGH